MISSNIVNTLFKQFPYKCQDLELILDSINNPKDLSNAFELLINCIFGIEHGLNLTQTDKSFIRWPLRLIDKYDYKFDYDCVYNFLSTESYLWSLMFKLTNLQIRFKYSINILPSQYKYRIENGCSFLSSRLDSMNCLNLNALEYYLLCFACDLLNADIQRCAKSTRLYDEFRGLMNLNCVYSDLLNNYLNYFLPINKRDVDFPTLLLTNQTTNIMYQYANIQQPSQINDALSPSSRNMYPRLLKQIHTTGAAGANSQLLKSESTSSLPKMDRTNDLKKIDFFIRLLVDVWISSFDGSEHIYANIQAPMVTIDIIFAVRDVIEHVYSFSNANYSFSINGPTQNSRFFDSNNNTSTGTSHYPTPIDDLRIMIYDTYFRKRLYWFYKHNLENWPLQASIKLLIETWLFTIQPWCSTKSQEELKYEEYLFNIHPTRSIWSSFIHDNIFTYVDIFHLIMKRYCNLDLTLTSTMHLLYRICLVLNQRYIIETIKEVENDIIAIKNFKLSTQRPTAYSLKHMQQHQQQQKNSIINIFKDFDKQINLYKSMYNMDNHKISLRLIDLLVNLKQLLMNEQTTQIETQSFFRRLFKSDTSSKITKLSHLSTQECHQLLQMIDECASLLHKIYEEQVDETLLNVPPPPIGSPLTSTISASTSMDESLTRQQPPEYTVSDDGMTVRLSPNGRFQMLNKLRKSDVQKVYDPMTAPISEFENRFLVFLLNNLSIALNKMFYNKIQNIYNRDDYLGHLSRRYLYGPQDVKNIPNISYQLSTSGSSCNSSGLLINKDAYISLRYFADYRFIVYFFIILIMFIFLFGYSFTHTILIFAIICLILSLVRAYFSYMSYQKSSR